MNRKWTRLDQITGSKTVIATGSYTGSAIRTNTRSATESITGITTVSNTGSANGIITGSATGSRTEIATKTNTGSATGSSTGSVTGTSTRSATEVNSFQFWDRETQTDTETQNTCNRLPSISINMIFWMPLTPNISGRGIYIKTPRHPKELISVSCVLCRMLH